jgi:hypothetical protein
MAMTETLAPTTTYCTLARVGYWASLDAKCETSAPDEYGILSHDISFVLIAQFGDRVYMGFRIINQQGQDVWDEDGNRFPNADAAIRAQADAILRITPMPGRRVSDPPRHELSQEEIGVAFPYP